MAVGASRINMGIHFTNHKLLLIHSDSVLSQKPTHTASQTINQSIKQPTSQLTSQPVNQSTGKSIE